jgi:hypothetical protein
MTSSGLITKCVMPSRQAAAAADAGRGGRRSMAGGNDRGLSDREPVTI